MVENVRRTNMNMKFCKNRNCTQQNPQLIENFVKAPKYKTGYFPDCRTCKKEYDRKRNDLRRDAIRKQSSDYYKNNKEKVQARHKAWREKNKEYTKNYLANYYKERPGVSAAKVMKYVTSKKRALPKWLTKEQFKEIENIYITCPNDHEVDHIIPLQGKNVSGLHVPWNLQHLPIKENRSKSNKC